MKYDFKTYLSSYEPAMRIRSKKVAAAYFKALVDFCLELNPKRSRAKHESIQRSNLGYWAGYHDEKTRRRVERLFGAKHPVFGSVKKAKK